MFGQIQMKNQQKVNLKTIQMQLHMMGQVKTKFIYGQKLEIKLEMKLLRVVFLIESKNHKLFQRMNLLINI